MTRNVTYVFGAGASCKALPMVKQMPARIKDIANLLKLEKFQLSATENYPKWEFGRTKNELQLELVEDLFWLNAASQNHASIDTLAKKFFIKQDYQALRRLKIALSAFLILEQARSGVDDRYDSFFASILTSDIVTLPNHVRIVSWNYDLQFEKAFSEFTDRSEVHENHGFLRISTKYNRTNSINDGFGLYKINGYAGFYSDQGIRQYDFHGKVNSNLDIPIIDDVVRNYGALKYHNQNFHPSISFAWERDFNDNDIFNRVTNAVASTNALVVVGYSFPFFNRDVDRKVIGGMKNLEKVYFQAPDANSLKERFLGIREDIDDKNLLTRFDTEQFVLPNEL